MEMKYLKTYESFNTEEVNENWFSGQVDKIKGLVKNFKLGDLFKKETEVQVEKELKSKTFSDEEKNQLAQELADLCNKTGLTPEKLTDHEEVTNALQILAQNKKAALNEGVWWKDFKVKHAGFFKKIGIGLTLLGIISIGVDANMANLSNLDAAGEATRTIGPLAMFAGAAISIGLISLNIGLNNIKAKIIK
jgi:hypothetical protein